MPQVFNVNDQPHKMWPVRSFENYLEHLSPKWDLLWQHPLKKISTNGSNWYKAKALGHNPIKKFLSRFSIECELSQYYTNHCICVTGITNFKRNHCSDCQIMSASVIKV